MENIQPTWVSRLSTLLLGKKAVMTVLDTAQIIKYQASKSNLQSIKPLTRKAYTAWNGILWTSIFSSLFIHAKFFNEQPWLNFSYLRISVPLALSFAYLGIQIYSTTCGEEVSRQKKKYYQVYEPIFMEHLKVLKFKYEIDQSIQFQGIFSEEEMAKWASQYLSRQSPKTSF